MSVFASTALPHLVADVGGTNARFALTGAGECRPRDERVYRCADYPGLEDAIEHYLREIDAGVAAASVAVATPLTGDHVQMTNHRWSFSIAAARERLGLDELLVLNDFTALALSIPHLGPESLRQVGGGSGVAGTPIALIGPGTGLGVSGLVPAGDRLVPLQSEGGHVTYGAATRRETEILSRLGQRFNHISAERLLSGPGLVNLYQAIGELAATSIEPLTPAEITAHALSGTCEICAEVLETFCAMLGTAAGNLVLTLGARAGVYIGGGIVPQLGEYFERSGFRASFEHRGRFSTYLAAVPSYVIHAERPALLGAAAALGYPPREVGIVSRHR